MEHKVRHIGVVHSSLKNLKDCPRQETENAPEATVEIFSDFKPGMSDIEPGAELIIITWLHHADRTVLKTKPRNEEDAKLTGVFSTRSPDRPNPIGMHVAKVVSVDGVHIRISCLEVLDGTPVIDIKPVL